MGEYLTFGGISRSLNSQSGNTTPLVFRADTTSSVDPAIRDALLLPPNDASRIPAKVYFFCTFSR